MLFLDSKYNQQNIINFPNNKEINSVSIHNQVKNKAKNYVFEVKPK